jgi:hypothetical protein
VFDYLEANPIVEVGKTAQALGIFFNTASGAVKRLAGAGANRSSLTYAFAYASFGSLNRRRNTRKEEPP